jgi:hypothetical protein
MGLPLLNNARRSRTALLHIIKKKVYVRSQGESCDFESKDNYFSQSSEYSKS